MISYFYGYPDSVDNVRSSDDRGSCSVHQHFGFHCTKLYAAVDRKVQEQEQNDRIRVYQNIRKCAKSNDVDQKRRSRLQRSVFFRMLVDYKKASKKKTLRWFQKNFFETQKSAQIINPHWDSHNPMNNDAAMSEHLQEYFGLNFETKSRFQCWAESASMTSLLHKTISKRKAIGSCLWPISGVLTSIVLQFVTNARYKK